MGIGISYTGHDGKTRHFDNGETARKFLDSLAPEAKRHTGEALRRAMQGLPSPMQGRSNKANVLPGGSVVESPDGLCLRGEEQSPLVEGVKMFASVNGSKGFKSMAEIDPPGSAALCGPAFGCDDIDEDASVGKVGEAVRRPFVSRNKMVYDPKSGLVTLYEFIREDIFSPGGRWVGCTKERRRVVGSFTIGGGGGNGKYGVKPVFGGGGLSALLFGTEAELDGGNPSSIVTTTTCPNAGGGNG